MQPIFGGRRSKMKIKILFVFISRAVLWFYGFVESTSIYTSNAICFATRMHFMCTFCELLKILLSVTVAGCTLHAACFANRFDKRLLYELYTKTLWETTNLAHTYIHIHTMDERYYYRDSIQSIISLLNAPTVAAGQQGQLHWGQTFLWVVYMCVAVNLYCVLSFLCVIINVRK